MMDEYKLSDWTERAVYITTKLDGGDSKSNIPLKYDGFRNILTEIYKELGSTIDVCLNEIQSPNRKQMRIDRYRSFLDEINHIWKNCDLGTIFDLLQNHLSEIEEYENDDEIKERERYELLVKYKNIMGIRNIGSDEPHPDIIYCDCAKGLYRRYYELRNFDDYKVCRKIVALNSRGEDIRTIFKAIYLYLSILNEKIAVEKLASTLGITLQEPITNAIETAHNGLKKQNGVDIPLEPENSAEERLRLFLEYVPPKNKDKAMELLQKIVEAGHCDTKYYWDASKWRNESDSVLALAYFAVRASEYLDFKVGEYEGKKGTFWKPFELLFIYPKYAGGLKKARRNYIERNSKETFPPKFIFNKIEKLFE